MRDALLAEAKYEFQRALKVGGPGRYTGQRIGSFQLGMLIGRGAMGEVYEASHIGTDQAAAVKLLHPHILSDPRHIRRFLRELRIVAALDEPHVVRVLEVPETDGGLPYLAMERLHGCSLSEHLKEHARLALGDVVELVCQVGRGLVAAHAAGIVHRDLKPTNIFRATQPGGGTMWKLLDFGVAKVIDTDGTLTQGGVVGTPTYMAPEQAHGEEVDSRADVYSLAVVAYRAVTGRPAFVASEPVKVLRAVADDMPPRPGSIVPLPHHIDMVFAVAMAKAPDDRFAEVEHFTSALITAARGQQDESLRRHARRILRATPWA